MCRLALIVSLMSFSLSLMGGTAAEVKKTPPQQNQKGASWMNDQQDQTDTYAIPLDTSEEEENQEMEQLQKENQKLKKQKQP